MAVKITRETIEKYRQDLVIRETLCGQAMLFQTSWGLFSPREVDAGSRLLLEIRDGRNSDQNKTGIKKRPSESAFQ